MGEWTLVDATTIGDLVVCSESNVLVGLTSSLDSRGSMGARACNADIEVGLVACPLPDPLLVLIMLVGWGGVGFWSFGC